MVQMLSFTFAFSFKRMDKEEDMISKVKYKLTVKYGNSLVWLQRYSDSMPLHFVFIAV